MHQVSKDSLGTAIILSMRDFILLFTLFINPLWADQPLFSPKEAKELNYYSSQESIAHKLQDKISKVAEAKMKVALEFYVRQDKTKRTQFFRPGLWEREDKRENFMAMKKWLQMISPITEETKKD